MKAKVGDYVCDCRFKHLKITDILPDGDTVILEDGSNCSLKHCCDDINHDWTHPYVD